MMIERFFAAFVSGLMMRRHATPLVDRVVGPVGWNTISHQAVGVVLAYPALEATVRYVYHALGGVDERRVADALRLAYFLAFFWTGLGVVCGWLLDSLGGEQ